jgi:molecular chaperone GrpE
MKPEDEEKRIEVGEEQTGDTETPDTNAQLAEIETLQKELGIYKEQLIRLSAERENQRKRVEREMDNARKYALQEFISRLLPAKDSMEKGLDVAYMEEGIDAETLLEGSTSTLKIFNEAFKATGVEEIDPLGKAFDPELHEAMTVKKIEGKKPNIVLDVYQKGYVLNGRLIRPARVEVST